MSTPCLKLVLIIAPHLLFHWSIHILPETWSNERRVIFNCDTLTADIAVPTGSLPGTHIVFLYRMEGGETRSVAPFLPFYLAGLFHLSYIYILYALIYNYFSPSLLASFLGTGWGKESFKKTWARQGTRGKWPWQLVLLSCLLSNQHS